MNQSINQSIDLRVSPSYPNPTLSLRPNCSFIPQRQESCRSLASEQPSLTVDHLTNCACNRDISNDTPLTKEEQLLGYTLVQRQRMKALHILGLTEESFERCRAVMLSSLGPSAFGYTADETAKSAARAEAEEGWTPGDKFRRKGPGQDGGGLHSNLLRMPTFGHHIRYRNEPFN